MDNRESSKRVEKAKEPQRLTVEPLYLTMLALPEGTRKSSGTGLWLETTKDGQRKKAK
jgi:hypothetical protein